MLSEPTYLAARMVAPALAVHFAQHWADAARLGGPALAPPPPAAPEAPLPVLTAHDQVFVKEGERCWFVKLADVRLFEISGGPRGCTSSSTSS